MDRNQFLKQAGLLVLAMVGITSLLNVLDPKQQKQSASTANGPSYGASVYGGGKK